MIIVDTCCFIDLFRGKPNESLEVIIVGGLALVSSTVYLELLQGVRKSEEIQVRNFLATLGEPLPWPIRTDCLKLINLSRGSRMRVGLPDILVLADTLGHGAKLMTYDRELAKLARKAKIDIVF